jgi:hypothetical protein
LSTAFQIEGDRVQGEILFRESTHEYFHQPTGRKLASVSSVISTVYNLKSWDGVDPAVVENARVRGSAVDAYMASYVRNQRLEILNELADVTERVVIAHRVWEQEFHGLPAEPQLIVYSLEDGVAGTMDFFVDRRVVVDLKNTYSKERGWILQLGSYCDYAPTKAERAGIIHVSPKTYPKGGAWIEFDVAECRRYWRMAVSWWKETKTMKGEKK